MIPGERIRSIGCDRVPGIAVLVVDPEDVQAAGADGLADIAEHIPPRPRWSARGSL
jgi:hypothetical protein